MLNILVAYPYMKKDVVDVLFENRDSIRFLLDSGAFTAWKSGKPIELDDYCRFIENLPFKPWRYFNLDVIGDGDASFKNYEIMLKRGFSPIPIFTRGEDIEVLEEYYKTSDVVGIGGLVKTKGSKGFVKGVMRRAGDRKIHWLGFTARDMLAYYRPYMCDCSSWNGAMKYGRLSLYDMNGRWLDMTKRNFAKKPSREVFRILDDYGMPPERLSQRSQWKSSGKGIYALEVASAKSWARFHIDISQKLGIKFFLACAGGGQVRMLFDAYNYWIKWRK